MARRSDGGSALLVLVARGRRKEGTSRRIGRGE